MIREHIAENTAYSPIEVKTGMNEERIIELEIKVAYQEDLLQALNSIVVTQQKQIGRLEETCKLLHEKLLSLAHTERKGPAAADERPPHY